MPDSLNRMFKKTPFFRDGSAYADLCDGGRVPQRKRELVLMQFTVRHFRHIAMGGTAIHGVVDPAREMWLALYARDREPGLFQARRLCCITTVADRCAVAGASPPQERNTPRLDRTAVGFAAAWQILGAAHRR